MKKIQNILTQIEAANEQRYNTRQVKVKRSEFSILCMALK